MSLKEFYPAIEMAYHMLEPVYAPAIQSGCIASGLNSAEFYLLIAVPTFLPDAVSVEVLQVRGAYTSPQHYESILKSLESKKMLVNIGSRQYTATETGLNIIKEIMQSVRSAVASIQPLTVTEMMDLASRLKDCADACMNAPEPPGTWSIRHARRQDPGPRAAVMARIEQFLTELIAYRDDAHLAAWRSYEPNGHAWDVLTLLWTEKEMYIEEINAKLKRRGHSLDHTRLAVENLIKKGWVTQDQEIVQITAFGADVRKIAEETTNRYYYLPFKSFTESEMDATIQLVDKFRRALPKS